MNIAPVLTITVFENGQQLEKGPETIVIFQAVMFLDFL
jgi:hypothetical protein